MEEWGAGCGSRGTDMVRPAHRTPSSRQNKSAKAARLFRPSHGLGRAPGDGAMMLLLWVPPLPPPPGACITFLLLREEVWQPSGFFQIRF